MNIQTAINGAQGRPAPADGTEAPALLRLDAEGRITGWGEAAARLTGLAAAEVLGRSHALLFPPEARQAGEPAHALRLAAAQEVHEEVAPRLRADGTLFRARSTLLAQRDAEGRLSGYTLLLRGAGGVPHGEPHGGPGADAGLRAALEGSGQAVLVTDEAGRVLEANAAAGGLLGHPEGGLAGRALTELLGMAGERDPAALAMREAAVRLPDGTARLLDIGIGTWCDAAGRRRHTAVLRDVTAGHAAEAARREAEERWRRLADTAPLSIVVIDVETRAILEFNDQAAEQLGYTREEFARLTLWDIEVASREEIAARKRYRGQKLRGRIQFATRHRMRDGRLRDVLVTSERIERDGRMVAQSAWLDITDRRQAEAALAASEERLRLAIEGAGLATWDLDLGQETVLWSANHFHMLGYPVDPSGRATVTMWRDRVHPDDLPAVTAEWERAERVDGRWRLAYRVVRLDGAVIWIEGHGRMLDRPEGGRRFIGVVKDVTAERTAQAALAEAEERLRLALEGAGFGTWDFLQGDSEAVWSDRMFALMGYQPAATGRVPHAMWRDRVQPEDLPHALDSLARALERGGAFTIGYRVRWPDGSERMLEEHGRVRTLPDGRRRCIGVVRDVTAERTAQATLADQERRLRLALDAAHFATWDRVLGEDEGAVWSERYFTMLGLPPDPEGRARLAWLRGRLHPEDLPRLEVALEEARAADGRYHTILRCQHAAGHWITLESHGRLLPLPDGRTRFIGVVRDVTEAHRAHAALETSETRLRLALQSTGAGLWDLDLVSGTARVDENWVALLGHAPEGRIAWAEWEALIHPEDRQHLAKSFAKYFAGATRSEAEYRVRHRDGHWMWMQDHATVVEQDEAGRPLRMVGLCRDITRRKAAQAAVEAGEARLRAVLDTVPECVKVVDPEARLVSMNAAGLRMLGATGPVEGAYLPEMVVAEDREAWCAAHARICAGERMDYDFRILTPDGRRLRMAANGMPIRLDDGRTGQLAVTRDVTERREAEARLSSLQADAMRASRIGAVGAMAAGLAHELNQPLGAVANYAGAARLLLERLPVPEEAAPLRGRLRDAILAAGAEAVRAGDIVQRLRDFVGRAEGELATIPVATLVAESCEAAEAALSGIGEFELDSEVDPLAGDVFADVVQIRQVLANLVRNAAEAVQGAAQRRVTLRATRGDSGVEFAVSDTGPGIAPGMAARLFEPFASGKSGGMGIGLAICRTIVEAHGGTIWADPPAPGRGATFRFTLPDADAGIGED